jgi:hypothetical protein
MVNFHPVHHIYLARQRKYSQGTGVHRNAGIMINILVMLFRAYYKYIGMY